MLACICKWCAIAATQGPTWPASEGRCSRNTTYVHDKQWARMFVRVCPYLPFSMRICSNPHHRLANRLRQEGSDFRQCSNDFLSRSNPQRLQQLADSLTSKDLPYLWPEMAGLLYTVLPRDRTSTRTVIRAIFKSSRERYQWYTTAIIHQSRTNRLRRQFFETPTKAGWIDNGLKPPRVLHTLSEVINDYAVSYSCFIRWMSNLERHEPAVS